MLFLNHVLGRHNIIQYPGEIGAGGGGVVILDPRGHTVKNFTWGLEHKNNNEEKWMALLQSLEIIENRDIYRLLVFGDSDPKTRSLLLYDVNMNCIKSMNEAHISIRREPNSIDNTHIKTTS